MSDSDSSFHDHHLNIDPITHAEQMLKLDMERDTKNFFESARLMFLVVISSLFMGFAGWFFLDMLSRVTGIYQHNTLLIWLLPLVGVFTAYVYQTHGSTSARGNNLVISSALKGEKIPFRMAPLILIFTLLTHLTGGSAGKEGTAIQMGATIASNLGDIFHINRHDHHILILSGISAAFGSVFGAPLAGTFFGLEICFIGKLDYASILYCFFASFLGNAVTRGLGIEHATRTISSIPAMTPVNIMLIALCAICFGLVARLFTWSLRTVKKIYAHHFKNYLLAACAGAFLVTILVVVSGSYQFCGLSTWLIDAGFAGETSFVDAFIKLFLTALTLGAGCQGGEVTPLFGIGAALGGWMGLVLGIDTTFLAALGMLAVFGAATNVPMTTIMLAFDMFGGIGAPWFVGTAFIAYLIAGHRSVYVAQTIITPKRRSLIGDKQLTVVEAIKHHDKEPDLLKADTTPGTSDN